MLLTSHQRLMIPAVLGEVMRFTVAQDPVLPVPVGIFLDNDSDLDVVLHFDASNDRAFVDGTVLDGADGYAIVKDTNDKFKVSIDGGTAVTVTLTANANQTAAVIAANINAAFLAAKVSAQALVTGAANNKVIRIISGTSGPGSSVEIVAVAADAYTDLGFTAGKVTNLDSFTPDIVSTVTVKAYGFAQFTNPRPGAQVLRIRGSASKPVMMDATVTYKHNGIQK